MLHSSARACPICGCEASGLVFPYATRFNDISFSYLACGKCKSVFVDPVPDSQTLERMYAKSTYHDLYYDGAERDDYVLSARLLSQHLKPGATVLDYGCGTGGFLRACASQGLVPFGVEFDSEAAKFAGQNAKCGTMSVTDFGALSKLPIYDAIHFGDVLEHLTDPAATLSNLLKALKPGGILFVEGPLEVNPSLVFWAARIFGILKRAIRPRFVPSDAPTHLFRTDADSQKAFFIRVDKRLTIAVWEVYETGWPYKHGGSVVKRIIAAGAERLGGQHVGGITFGNRFKAIMIKPE